METAKERVQLWTDWVDEHAYLWRYIHVSGLFLRRDSVWVNAGASFVLSDASIVKKLDGIPPAPDGDVCAFREVLEIEALPKILAGLTEGVLPSNVIPQVSDRIVFNNQTQIEPTTDPRHEPPSEAEAPDFQRPHVWPRYVLEFSSGTVASAFGPGSFRWLTKLDARLEGRGTGRLSALSLRFGLRNVSEDAGAFGGASTKVTFIAPVHLRIAGSWWDNRLGHLLCDVKIGAGVPRDRVHVVLSHHLSSSDPVGLPSGDGDSVRLTMGSQKPPDGALLVATIDGEPIHRIPAQTTPRPTLRVESKATASFQTWLDSYTQISKISSGGGGVVYLVRDEDGTERALKVIHVENLNSRDRAARFRAEVLFCQRHVHKNIVKVLDTGFTEVDDEKCPFYVMPYYEDTLRKVMQRNIPPTERLKYFEGVLAGMEAVHDMNVWHRDLKPENILISGEEVVVSDFGIAHFSSEDRPSSIETKRGDRLANTIYRAPEQLDKDGNVDHRADIFALGLILNEIFTGKPPLAPGHPLIGSAFPELSELDEIVGKMTQHDPDQRPASIVIVRSLIQDAVGRMSSSEATLRGASEREPPQPADRSAGVPGLSAAAVNVGAFMLKREDNSRGIPLYLAGDDFADLQMTPRDLNDAVSDLESSCLVEVTRAMGGDPFDFLRVAATYHLPLYLGAERLSYDPSRDIDITASKIVSHDDDGVDAGSLMQESGLPLLRLNRAIEWLKAGNHVSIGGIGSGTEFVFDWCRATAATRRLVRERNGRT